MEFDVQRVKDHFKKAVEALYQTNFCYAKEVAVEGLIGITLDRDNIVLLNLNERFKSEAEPVTVATGKNACILRGSRKRKSKAFRLSCRENKNYQYTASEIKILNEQYNGSVSPLRHSTAKKNTELDSTLGARFSKDQNIVKKEPDDGNQCGDKFTEAFTECDGPVCNHSSEENAAEDSHVHPYSVRNSNPLSVLGNENTSNEYKCNYFVQSFESKEEALRHIARFSEKQDQYQGYNASKDASETLAIEISPKTNDTGHSGRVKYTTEQKREMVLYALEHGSAKTAQEFSIRFKMPVSVSAVRLAMKNYYLTQEGREAPLPKPYHKPITYNKYTKEQKIEIAKHAIQHGPSKAAHDFSIKWGIRIGESFVRTAVRNFKKKLEQKNDMNQ